MNVLLIILYTFYSYIFFQETNNSLFRSETGLVNFESEAPLETISASSDALKGIIDTTKKTFAFSVQIKTFQGFNSPLQKEHFNENYMESDMFPTASFSGKIIEELRFSEDGSYQVRAKGRLIIHGVSQERLIKVSLEIEEKIIKVKSDFLVSLSDHDIKIPRIVYQKISPDIEVSVEAILKSNAN